MTNATTLKTAIWLPVVRSEEDYNLLPDEWQVTGFGGFNVHRASILERHEALVAKASKARGVAIELRIVKATPQYMLRALADRAYNVKSTNEIARLLSLAPGFDPSIEYDA